MSEVLQLLFLGFLGIMALTGWAEWFKERHRGAEASSARRPDFELDGKRYPGNPDLTLSEGRDFIANLKTFKGHPLSENERELLLDHVETNDSDEDFWTRLSAGYSAIHNRRRRSEAINLEYVDGAIVFVVSPHSPPRYSTIIRDLVGASGIFWLENRDRGEPIMHAVKDQEQISVPEDTDMLVRQGDTALVLRAFSAPGAFDVLGEYMNKGGSAFHLSDLSQRSQQWFAALSPEKQANFVEAFRVASTSLSVRDASVLAARPARRVNIDD